MMKMIISLFLMMSSLFLSGCASNGADVPVDNAWNKVDSTQSVHKVQPGETIYSIAWRYGIDYQQIAGWNHLEKPYHLKIGQVLHLAPPKDETQPKVDAAPSFTPVSSTAAAVGSGVAGKTLASNSNSSSSTSKAGTTSSTAQAAGATESSVTKVASNGSNWAWPVNGKVIKGYGADGNKGIDIAVPAGTPVKAVQNGTVVYAGNNLRGYGDLVIVKQKDNLMTAYAHNSRLLVKEGSTVKAGQTIAMSGDTEAARAMLHFEVRAAGKPVDPLPYLK